MPCHILRSCSIRLASSFVYMILKAALSRNRNYGLSEQHPTMLTADLKLNKDNQHQAASLVLRQRRRLEIDRRFCLGSRICFVSVVLKETAEFNRFYKQTGWIQPFLPNRSRQNSWRSKELNKFCPPNRRDDLCLAFCFHHSSMFWGQASSPCSIHRSCHF